MHDTAEPHLARLDASRLRFRDELIAIGPDLLRLLDKASDEDGLSALTLWDRAVLGMCLGFVVCELLTPVPEPEGVSIEPSRN